MTFHPTSLFRPVSLVAEAFHFASSNPLHRREPAAELSVGAADLNGELPAVLSAFDSSDESDRNACSDKKAPRLLTMVLDNDKTKVTSIVESIVSECDALNLIEEPSRFKVSIALEEALLNAIIHGNLEVSSELRERGDDSFEQLIEERCGVTPFCGRRVTVECRLSTTKAAFVISDEGPGFDVRSVPDPTDPDYLDRPCGRGMLLMRTFMDEVRYNDRGNSVTLVKFGHGGQ